MPTNWPLCLYSKMKSWKLKLNIPSFLLFDRFKHSKSSLHRSPMPSVCIVNLRASQNKYPNLPAPPPSTPEQDSLSSSVVISPGYSGQSIRGAPYLSPSADYSLADEYPDDHNNSWSRKVQMIESVPGDELPFRQVNGRHSSTKKHNKVKGNDGPRVNMKMNSRVSPGPKDGVERGDIESESLLSDCGSFAYGSPVEVFIASNSPKCGSKEWNRYKVRKSNEKTIPDQKVKLVKSRRQLETKRKVGLETQARNRTASFAVVKNSNDPCEDFRISMLEMILEKEMFETKELEDLLHCFLSLNSRHYHPIIVQAFTDVWEMLFCQAYSYQSKLVF